MLLFTNIAFSTPLYQSFFKSWNQSFVSSHPCTGLNNNKIWPLGKAVLVAWAVWFLLILVDPRSLRGIRAGKESGVWDAGCPDCSGCGAQALVSKQLKLRSPFGQASQASHLPFSFRKFGQKILGNQILGDPNSIIVAFRCAILPATYFSTCKYIQCHTIYAILPTTC